MTTATETTGTTGVLLVNLGTPASPALRDVRRYLREFLGDPHVIDLPAPLRFALVNGIIAPFRARRSAHAYRSVWTEAGSPLAVHHAALAESVAKRLGASFRIEAAMRYGEPSIATALGRLISAGATRLVAVPLFPQAASSTTGSIRHALHAAARSHSAAGARPIEILGPFWAEPGFAAAWRDVAGPVLARARPDHVLFSYHGLPERHLRRADRSGEHCLIRPGCCDAPCPVLADCYRAQCIDTTRRVAAALELAPESTSTAFQSRLGRARWIEPYTDVCLSELAAQGVRRLAVLCPSFVADCLETLEEIGARARTQWSAAGGDELVLVPSLNAHPTWVDAVCGMLRSPAA